MESILSHMLEFLLDCYMEGFHITATGDLELTCHCHHLLIPGDWSCLLTPFSKVWELWPFSFTYLCVMCCFFDIYCD